MKIPRALKKIDIRVLQHLLMIVIIGGFIYFFYHGYGQYTRYRQTKLSDPRVGGGESPVTPPEFHSFNIDADPAQFNQYLLFTLKENKQNPPQAGEDTTATQPVSNAYTILGVVKKDHYYVVVRMSDHKIRLFADGETIVKDTRVRRITPLEVTLAGPSGKEQSHKVFKLATTNIITEKTGNNGNNTRENKR